MHYGYTEKAPNALEEQDREIRKLRDNIYGVCSEHTWSVCGPNWKKPENILWLLANQPKE